MKKLFTLLFLCTATLLFSQDFSIDLVKNMKPRNIGPGYFSKPLQGESFYGFFRSFKKHIQSSRFYKVL